MKREMNFENFYVYEGNKVAYLAAQKIVELPGELFSPLYIYSGTGLGKTHLLWALRHALKEKHPVRFFTAQEFEKYLDETHAVETALLVDDLHTLERHYHEVLLGIIDTLLTSNKQICFSGNVAPRRLRNIDPRLLSRLEGGLVCDIVPPKEMALVEMIKKKSGEAGIILPDEIALELAQISTGSIRTIEGMINRLVAYSSLASVTLDVNSVRMILKEFYPKGIYSPVSSLLEELKKNATEVLQGISAKVDVREEYREKIYVWEMKGFDTSSLRSLLDGDIALLKQEYDSFITKVERLIKLQREFGALDTHQFPEEAMKIESMLFSPDRIEEIEELMAVIKHGSVKEADKSFKTYIVTESNKNVLDIYKQHVLPNLGQKYNPFIIYGKEGTGKTRFLEAVARDFSSQGKKVVLLNLADVDDIVKLDTEEYDVLLLDNFHNTFSVAQELRKKIFDAVLLSVRAGKPLFYSAKRFPKDVSLSEDEKSVFECGIESELKPPTAETVQRYVQMKVPASRAQRIINEGLPSFASFHDIDAFLASVKKDREEEISFAIPDKDSVVRAQEGDLVSLGLPGEEQHKEREPVADDVSEHREREEVVALGLPGEESIEAKKEEEKAETKEKGTEAEREYESEKEKIDMHRFLSQEIPGEMIEESY